MSAPGRDACQFCRKDLSTVPLEQRIPLFPHLPHCTCAFVCSIACRVVGRCHNDTCGHESVAYCMMLAREWRKEHPGVSVLHTEPKESCECTRYTDSTLLARISLTPP